MVAGGGDGGRVVAGRSVSVAGVRSRKCVKWSQELHASLQRGQVRPGANAHGHDPCKSPQQPCSDSGDSEVLWRMGQKPGTN